jgi:hypothetical protein
VEICSLDLSKRRTAFAAHFQYPKEALKAVPEQLRRYFNQSPVPGYCGVDRSIASHIDYLSGDILDFKPKQPFDIVFAFNLMGYCLNDKARPMVERLGELSSGLVCMNYIANYEFGFPPDEYSAANQRLHKDLGFSLLRDGFQRDPQGRAFLDYSEKGSREGSKWDCNMFRGFIMGKDTFALEPNS